MIRAVLLSLALLAAAPAAAQTKVAGDWISLGDIAPVTGDAAKILVSPSPPPGQTLALDPAFVVSVAKKSGVLLALPIDAPILVTRQGQLASAPVAPTAPVARTAPQAKQAPLPPMSASQDPPEGWVLVMARDVARGGRIAESDLQWADPVLARPGRLPPQDVAAAVGLEARRTLKAGLALQMSDLKTASVVRKGQPVKLIYTAPGMRLSVDGLAQSDAAVGENVRVLNGFSKRTIEAVATADGEARVFGR